MLILDLSEIKRVEGMIYEDNEYISLSQGKIKIGSGIPQKIKDHVAHLMNGHTTDYYQSAWGIPLLRSKIAAYLNEQHNTALTSENIIVTHGSIGALALIMLCLTSPGDEILLPEPTYPAYKTLAHAARCTPRFISCDAGFDEHRIQQWSIDLEKIQASVTPRTKMIIFSNPSNPTGTLINRQTLTQLAAWCEQQGIYLIIDEVYDDYIFQGTMASATPLILNHQHVIRTGSFSKNFCMSGWRVGYMAIPTRLTTALGRFQDALLNCPNVISQYAALFALDHPDLIQHFHKVIEHNRNLVHTMLEPLMHEGIISYQTPAAGFNFFIKLHYGESTDFVTTLRTEKKVTVIEGSAFGPSGKNFFRLCYARDTDVVAQGVTRIIDHLSSYRILHSGQGKTLHV